MNCWQNLFPKDDEDYPFTENQELYDRLIELVRIYNLWNEVHIEVSTIREAETLRQRDPRIRVVYYAASEDAVRDALSYPHYIRIGVPPGTATKISQQIRASGKKIHISKVTRSTWYRVKTLEPSTIGSDSYLGLLEFAWPGETVSKP
jgi:hypothetical protein